MEKLGALLQEKSVHPIYPFVDTPVGLLIDGIEMIPGRELFIEKGKAIDVLIYESMGNI